MKVLAQRTETLVDAKQPSADSGRRRPRREEGTLSEQSVCKGREAQEHKRFLKRETLSSGTLGTGGCPEENHGHGKSRNEAVPVRAHQELPHSHDHYDLAFLLLNFKFVFIFTLSFEDRKSTCIFSV